MEDPKVTQQHIIDDINNNTESWFGKATTKPQPNYEDMARCVVGNIDELWEVGSELHMEKDAYSPREYRKEQKYLSDEITHNINKVHKYYDDALEQGITLSQRVVASLQDRMTQDEDGNKNPNFDKCIVCGAEINGGFHEIEAYPSDYVPIESDDDEDIEPF